MFLLDAHLLRYFLCGTSTAASWFPFAHRVFAQTITLPGTPLWTSDHHLGGGSNIISSRSPYWTFLLLHSLSTCPDKTLCNYYIIKCPFAQFSLFFCLLERRFRERMTWCLSLCLYCCTGAWLKLNAQLSWSFQTGPSHGLHISASWLLALQVFITTIFKKWCMMCKNSDLRHCNERSHLGPSCTSAFLRSKFNSHGEQRRVARKRTKWKYKTIYSKQLHKTIKNDNGVEGWLRIIGIVDLEKPHQKQLIVFHTPPHTRVLLLNASHFAGWVI